MADGDYFVTGYYSLERAEEIKELSRLVTLAGKTGRRLEDKSRRLAKLSEEVLKLGESETSEIFSYYQNK